MTDSIKKNRKAGSLEEKWEMLRNNKWTTTKDVIGFKISHTNKVETNKEVEEVYGEPKINKIIRAQRIRWLGHIGRASQYRTIGKVLNRLQGGKKKKGRPKLRWLENVKTDL